VTADETRYNYKHLCDCAALVGGVEVRGLALLDSQLYVVRKQSSYVEVMDPVLLSLVMNISVPTMKEPGSMAACPVQKSLYISSRKKKEVLKISVQGLSVCLSLSCHTHPSRNHCIHRIILVTFRMSVFESFVCFAMFLRYGASKI